MRIKTSTLCSERLKHFRELADLDYSSLQIVVKNAEISAGNTGNTLVELAFNDPFAAFLLQGEVRLGSGYFQRKEISQVDPEARLMLNHLLPKGGCISALTDDTAILLIKRKFINDARLHYNQPLSTTEKAFGLNEGIDVDPGKQDWMTTLLASPLFQCLQPQTLQQLLTSLHEKPYSAGETVIHRGQHDNYFYILKSGRVKVILENETCEDVVLDPGHFFGEGALTGDTVHSATVEMLEDGIICLAHMDKFENILKDAVLKYVSEEEMEQILYSDTEAAVVLDVRHLIEYRHKHYPKSIHVPINKLRNYLKEKLSQDITYLIAHGEDKRSQVAALILIENGFDAMLIDSPTQQTLKAG